MPEKSEENQIKDMLNVFLHNFERFNDNLQQISTKMDNLNRQVVVSNQSMISNLSKVLKEDREANISLLNHLLEKYSVAANQLSIKIGDLAGIRRELQKMTFVMMGVTDANFKQVKVTKSLTAGQLYEHNFNIPAGKIAFLTKVKYGDITEDKIDVRYEGFNVGNASVRIDHELLSFETKFFPWIGMTSKSGKAVLKNNDTATQNFNAVYDFIQLSEKQYRKVFGDADN